MAKKQAVKSKNTATKKTSSTKATKSKSLKKLNETGRRAKSDDRRQVDEPVAEERRKKTSRRRQIDPTTCERDYTDQEIEFMHALDEYKRTSGRMFPTCSEILEVLQNLGYQKVASATPPALGCCQENAIPTQVEINS